jgi:ribonucleoside-diphosphate reductase alpha chain
VNSAVRDSLRGVSQHVWETKYRYRDGASGGDRTVEDTWRRIARSLSAVEPRGNALWEQRFFHILHDFKFLPGGRIQAGAGTSRNVTLFNWFVMGAIEDSMEGIFRALWEGALTMQQGGGVGYDFSTLRPRGSSARGVGAIASGPVSFMGVWDAMCETILSTGARRGAMIATLRCDHPDIEEFVSAKKTPGALRHFNLSVQVTDAFVNAVRNQREWPLVFGGSVYRTLRACDLWDEILRATYERAEPGVLFVDRINHANNLWYREDITATNPCGEIPLPPYGACDLGSLNLTRFVCDPFTPKAHVDETELIATAQTATRLLDDVIDASRFPLQQQEASAKNSRRVGLGITGLADALVMLGLHYGSDEARSFAAETMRLICHAAYETSVDLAREKGAFPAFDREKYLQGPFVAALPLEIRQGISRHGIRNSHLLAIAPAGTISLLAGNVSSGLEPVFAGTVTRNILNEDGTATPFELTDYALALWRSGESERTGVPPNFVCAPELLPRDHIAMQAALQPYVDNSISKTITVPQDYSFEAFKDVYDSAYDMGLKGCTTFRTNPVTGAVVAAAEESGATSCCNIEREPD